MDRVRIRFRFRLGQQVRYQGQVWTITHRWYSEGTAATWRAYTLEGLADWAYDADLEAVAEGDHPPSSSS